MKNSNNLKFCNRCKTDKHYSLFHRLTFNRISSICQDCFSAKQIERQLIQQRSHKICTDCLIDKEINLFFNSKTSLDKKCGICKDCTYKRTEEHRFNKPGLAKLRQERNQTKNRLKRNESSKKRYKTHKLRSLANSANHRSKNRFTGERITPLELFNIAKKQKLICPLTGLKLTNDNISIDHILPLSKGGLNIKENIRLVVWQVNNMRSNYDDDKFLELIKTIYLHNFK